MKQIYAREYVHASAVGDCAKCEHVLEKFDQYLPRIYEEKAIEGYDLMLLHNDQECEEELVRDDWKHIVGDVFPVVYLLVQGLQAPVDMKPEIEEYITGAGFVRVR
jgi:hypothetical protein